MRWLGTAFVLLALATVPVIPVAHAYIEAPHSLGQIVHESTNIVLVEVLRVNKEKNLVIYKKLKDLKGKEAAEEIKHNIGERGFHPREWQTIKKWAEVGKKAVFFHNGGASETCTGDYWYQCYREGEWWGMSHAEPFLLRTYTGDAEKLAEAITKMLKGESVVVTCFADKNKEQLHERKGRLQRMKASLKLLNYDAKRDFVAFGGEGDAVAEYRTINLLPEGSTGWRYLPAAKLATSDHDKWFQDKFSTGTWKVGKAPIGYGEAEIAQRKGTSITEQGQDFIFRRVVEVPPELLTQKGVLFHVRLASDDGATVFLNGVKIDDDYDQDHEFSYWNREVELQAKQFRPGGNVIAVRVRNKQGSSDLYLDMEIVAEAPVAKPAPMPQK
jgi:hypothetical protein